MCLYLLVRHYFVLYIFELYGNGIKFFICFFDLLFLLNTLLLYVLAIY